MASDAEQYAKDLQWLRDELWASEGPRKWTERADLMRRIIGYVRERERLETTLDYVASCFYVAVHGIKDVPTWQECDRQPCRTANGRLPSVQRVEASESDPA